AIAGILVMVSRPTTRSDRWLLVALGLITGGILGNLFDRLGLPGLRWHAPWERQGERVLAVRDWIHFRLEGVIDWPIFNLADSWLVIGAGLLLLLSLRQPEAAVEETAP
ncbi:MAG: signal peptidase II, partial [Planctomycetia bacterium]